MIACPKCSRALDPALANTGEFVPCAWCDSPLRIEIFPALFTGLQPGQSGEAILTESEAGCFYHAEKQAVVACESCGRFLCALCDIDFDGRHLCPACIGADRRKGSLRHIENQRMLHDNIALSLAVLPMIIVWPTLITAPAAIFVALYYWKAPSSVLPRTHVRSILALLIATAQIVGWIGFFTYLLNQP